MNKPMRNRQLGFSLIELLVVMFIFLIVSAAIFGLMDVAQRRYRAEQQLLDSLQGARIGIENLTRDIHRAGYPPLNSYDTVPAVPISAWTAAGGVPANQIAVPFVGMVGANIVQTCTVNGGVNPCTIPNAWELLIETDLEPDGTVDWIYYRLDTPGNAVLHPPTGGGFLRTLYRAVSQKNCTGPLPWVPLQCTGGTPLANTGAPFVENITQDPGAAIGAGNPALFTYVCVGGSLAAPGVCTPQNISEVYIVIQARAFSPDLQTRGVRALSLQSVAEVLNPPQ